MNLTIAKCERWVIEGEDMYPATWLESLVDLSVGKFGNDIQVLSSEEEKETENQDFSVANEGTILMGDKRYSLP